MKKHARPPRNSSAPRRTLLPMAFAACIAWHPLTLFATAKTFIGTDGSLWSTTTVWSPSGVPVNGDDVSLGTNNSGLANNTLVFTNSYTSPGLSSLTINPTAITGNFTLSQTLTGTALFASTETIGSTTGRAFYTQSAGNNTSANLDIGLSSGSFGTYNLSGTANLTANFEIVGSSGNGNFIQSGGTNSIVAGGSGGFMFVAGTGTSSYSLTGGLLNFSNASLNVGINNPATFTQSGGNLTFSGPNAEFDIGGNPSGTGNYTLNSGSISGVVNESVGQSGTGIFNQNGGSHSLAPGTTLFLGENGVAGSFNSHGTYNLANGSLAADFEIVGNSGTGAFNQTGGTNTVGTLTLVALSNGVGNYTLSAGTLTASQIIINANSTFTQNGGSLSTDFISQNGGTIAGTLQNSGTFLYNSGTFSGRLFNNGAVAFNADFTALKGIQNNSDFAIPLARTITANSPGLDNESNFTITGGTLAGTGPIVNNATFAAWGTIAGSGGFTNNLLFTQGPGNILFQNTGPNINAGTMTLAPGRQFQLPAGISLSNAGAFFLNGAAVTGSGSFANAAGATLTGPGLLSSTFTSNGILQPGNGLLNITTPWTNNGLIQLTDFTSNLAGATVTNAASIRGFGSISAPVINNNSIEATGGGGGTLTISGTLTNSPTGTLRTTAATEILILGSFPTNAGLIDLAGGTLDTANHTLTNTGTIAGFGVLSSGGLTNNANITFTGGTSTINGPLTNSAGQTINIKFQPALFTGNVTNNGTIKTTTTTATFTATFTNNGSFLSDPATNIFATLNNAGSISGGSGDVFTINSSFTNAGNFQNGGTLNASGTITNTATFTQSGPQSWSPGATFTNSSGAATFQSNAKLYGLTITAGTVDITTSKFIIEATTNKSATLTALQQNIATHSLIASNIPANYALALMDNAITNFSTFGNQPADPNSLLLSSELLGDANADGTVDLSDLSTILNNFGTTTSLWTSGNFDSAPTIDLTDLSDVLNNFGLSNPNAAASLSVATPAPEPASLALLALFAPLLRRRNTP